MKNVSEIILSTDRLILRTWKDTDIPVMATINSDLLVMEHFPSTQDFAATAELINRINLHYEKFGYAPYAVELKESQEFIIKSR